MLVNRRHLLRGSIAALIATMTFAAATATASPTAEVLLSGLSSPKALTIDGDGNPLVGQGAFGPPGPILTYVLRGPGRGSTVEILDEAGVVDVAVAPDGSGWAIGGDRMLYRMPPGGAPAPVFDIAAYQADDPDPADQDGDADESNPYGLAALPGGDALLTDAQNNDLLRVTPEGEATTVARLDVEEVSTDHLPGFPVPSMAAEAVPTSVTIGPDGFAYVSELKGFPFRPGTSHVWRVDPDAEDAVCSVNVADDDCSVYLSGFTGIQDIAFNLNNGWLYVYELAADGVLAFEEGFGTGQFPPAVLLKVKRHERSELVPGALSEPGGIAVARDGTVFVTDGVFTGGRLLRVRG